MTDDDNSWRAKARRATEGTQLGAILRAALGDKPDRPPYFGRFASVTSDGWLISDFCDKDGVFHTGAFVGSMSDLERNMEGLAAHLRLNAAEKREMNAVFRGWISKDWRML